MTATLPLFHPLHLAALALLCSVAPAQEPAPPAEAPFSTPEGLVRELYRAVSFEAGAAPDWDHVRSMFLGEAVVVLRTGQAESTVFDLDGFIDDFVRFSGLPAVQERGFAEKIVRMDSTELRDIAHVFVVYEATIPGSPRPPQQGLDSIQLIRRDDRWWVVSIVNDVPSPDHPLPEALKGDRGAQGDE